MGEGMLKDQYRWKVVLMRLASRNTHPTVSQVLLGTRFGGFSHL